MLKRAYRFVVSDYLLRNSAIIAASGVVVALINYVFQLFAARMLTVEDYGVMGAVFSLFYVVTFSGQAISYFTTKTTALAKNDHERSYALSYLLLKFIKLGGVFLIAYVLFTPLLGRFLHIQSYYILIGTGVLIFLSILNTVVNGFGRGLEDFLHPALAGAMNTLVKLVLGLGLIALGYGVAGVIGALIVASVVGIGYLLLRYRQYAHFSTKHKQIVISRMEFTWYFLILLFSILFINLDVLLVKHFFSEYDAGLYAALALLGKAVFFLSGAATPVVFPRIVKHIDSGEEHKARILFWKAIGLTTLAAGVAVLAYWLFPHLIVSLLYQNKYPVAELLLPMGIFVLLYSLLSILVLVSLALQRYKILIGLVLGVLAQTSLIIWNHESLLFVLLASIVGLLLGLILTGTILFSGPFKKPASSKNA